MKHAGIFRKVSIYTMLLLITFIINIFFVFSINSQEKSGDNYDIKNINLSILNVDVSNSGEISKDIYNLYNLEELKFTGNENFTISADIRKLSSLKVIDLSSTYIDNLPEELSQLRLLKEIHLNYERWQYRLDEVKRITRAKIILE